MSSGWSTSSAGGGGAGDGRRVTTRPLPQLHLVRELKEEAHQYPPYRLVIDHGTALVPAPLPPCVEFGEQACCFHNAFTLATREPDR